MKPIDRLKLEEAWANLPAEVKHEVLKAYQNPTPRNCAFAQGYLARYTKEVGTDQLVLAEFIYRLYLLADLEDCAAALGLKK